MQRPRILTLIMAGGKGARMEMLTQARAKPTLPFAGVYHLIDIPLSNCVHSRLNDVWVVEQFLPYSLNKYLANGRPWDLDQTYGGLQIIPPSQGTDDSGFDQGNADAIYRNREVIRDFDPDLIVVLSADHVYRLDYGDVIEQHLARDADVTMVITEVPLAEAGRFGNVEVGDDDRVTGFAYKPDEPQSTWATTEVFVYNAATLLGTLEELVRQKQADQGDDATLEDFGHELLPHLVDGGRAYAFRLRGYWRDVGTIESYWEGHIDLLAAEPSLNLDEKDWPILTNGVQRLPARIHASAKISNSFVSPGCVVHGDVIDSVLSPGVVVEQDAVVQRAVVLNDVQICAGARVEHAIIDRRVHVGANATVGAAPAQGDDPTITLVGQDAQIAADARVPAGARVEPRTTRKEAQSNDDEGDE